MNQDLVGLPQLDCRRIEGTNVDDASLCFESFVLDLQNHTLSLHSEGYNATSSLDLVSSEDDLSNLLLLVSNLIATGGNKYELLDRKVVDSDYINILYNLSKYFVNKPQPNVYQDLSLAYISEDEDLDCDFAIHKSKKSQNRAVESVVLSDSNEEQNLNWAKAGEMIEDILFVVNGGNCAVRLNRVFVPEADSVEESCNLGKKDNLQHKNWVATFRKSDHKRLSHNVRLSF